ncbi:uncharacterized protein J7T54_006275 [Emericellopsis cladophorae]|uniref:Uncharacterized protein n=1 Tax=Emericellopsis cladophorae TaxID=2686198 RepID=A0A9P9Y9H9_9HYPO|nr:uncharacterized protein J7T54_006275 [Emericellopsis cladophorae]KAI6785936.1 hypothetical protein J7T54_006275 [Emericellopsis cladophorae]
MTMPGLTIQTDVAPRSHSPEPPPASPLTPSEEASAPQLAPTQAAIATATPRQPSAPHPQAEPPAVLSHTTHPEQVPSQPVPPPQPIDFESNTDAIAIKSAISILQIQKKRAEEHIRLLDQSAQTARDDPQRTAEYLAKGDTSDMPWKDAFQMQSVAHMPNVRWSKYAVVGESLDKIHQEQSKRPPDTKPAVYADGVYTEQASANSSTAGRAEEHRGPFAAYSPFVGKGKQPMASPKTKK